MTTSWLRRALLACVGVAVAAGTVAPAAVPAAAPRRVAIERQAVSTSQTTTAHVYELYRHDARTQPVQWLACRPIAYRINASGEPRGMTKVIERVMGSIGKQTGASFVYAGRTTRGFDSTGYSHTVPTIYFAFTGKHDIDGQHFAWPGEVGVGGPAAAWMGTGSNVFEAATYGRVLLYTGFKAPRTGAGATWQSLITHEVGHALNLDHRTSTHDAMYPSLNAASPGKFTAGEVTALKRVLRRTSCDYAAFARL